MGTYIVLNNKHTKEYAIFDYRPGEFTNYFYNFRDMAIVHNCNKKQVSKLGTRLTVADWIDKHGLPSCIEGIYKNDWIPF